MLDKKSLCLPRAWRGGIGLTAVKCGILTEQLNTIFIFLFNVKGTVLKYRYENYVGEKKFRHRFSFLHSLLVSKSIL